MRGSDSEFTTCRCSVLATLPANCLDTERADSVMCTAFYFLKAERNRLDTDFDCAVTFFFQAEQTDDVCSATYLV